MGRRGLDACRGRFERGLWRGDGCPAEVARCRTRRLVGRRDRFGPRAAQLLVASVLPNATHVHENETFAAPRRAAHHYLRFAANSASREAGHVASFSRPSDRPSGRPRSCFPQPFCKKALELKRNQPAVQVPLLENFAKKPSAFLKINPRSNSAGRRKFTNKTLSFNKINPPSLSSLRFFFKKTLRF